MFSTLLAGWFYLRMEKIYPEIKIFELSSCIFLLVVSILLCEIFFRTKAVAIHHIILAL